MKNTLLALQARLSTLTGQPEQLVPMPDKGLAHWHARWVGYGLVARVPKQSQMGLSPADNLAYEAACFTRAHASGHTPRLHATLPPDAQLPWGALLVEEVAGVPAAAAHVTPALMPALAALHRLPLPPRTARAPLLDDAQPARGLLDQIMQQAQHLPHPRVPSATRALLLKRLRAMQAELPGQCAALPRTLIAFDAHPGNFIIRPNGQAVLVDLEKMRYSLAPLDLAHATLYTSTSWDIASAFTLNVDAQAQAYACWLDAMGAAGGCYTPALVPLREAMWLWSLTWCAQWLAESERQAKAQPGGQDWSAQHSDAALIDHVRVRVTDYLSPPCAQRMQDEFAQLRRWFG